MIDKKSTNLEPKDPAPEVASEKDKAAASAVGDLSSVASKMDYIDAALGVLSDPTRKLPPIGQTKPVDLTTVADSMKSSDTADTSPNDAPLPALSEKTAAALSRFQAAIGKAPKIDTKFSSKSAKKSPDTEKRKTRAEKRQLKRDHELKPEVSLKDIAADLPTSTKLPERTLQDLTAEFESSFSTELDQELSSDLNEAVELDFTEPKIAASKSEKPSEIKAELPTTSEVEVKPEPKAKDTPKPKEELEIALKVEEAPDPKPTYVASVKAPNIKTKAPPVLSPVADAELEKIEEVAIEAVMETVPDLPSPLPKFEETISPLDPTATFAANIEPEHFVDPSDPLDLEEDPAPKSLQNAVHELELGDLHDKQPDFTYLRHTIRKLHYRYMATNDVDSESREDFETVLKTLSLASVQYRMMKEKYDDYEVISKERDRESEKLATAYRSIKEGELAVEQLNSTIAKAEKEASVAKESFDSELEDMKSSLIAERESLKFDLERVKGQERKVMQRLEETSERLLESDTKLEDSVQNSSMMKESVALAQAEAEVLRNSLDEACEKIVLITSTNMQTEMRIQELEDEVAELRLR